MTEDKKKVVIGMSGGVDSSVAAWLLKQQGYDVLGVTICNWREEPVSGDKDSRGLSAVGDARQTAEKIGIPYDVINAESEFKKHVIDYFAEEYVRGRTPNPCVVCNRYVKWAELLRYGKTVKADYLATGHYACIEQMQNGRYALRESASQTKDQTYALYNLTQEQLSKTLMPAGAYTKEEIRAIAEREGLQTAQKPDSQEICFILDHDYAKFIEEYTGVKPAEGNFVDLRGNILGRHRGITHYTIGQRKGLGLAMGRPVFVARICPDTNEVVIADAEDLFTDTILCDKLNWMAVDGLHGQRLRVRAKIRYSHRGALCEISEAGEDLVTCHFPEKVRAAAPGQAIVFYDERGYVLGGGTIR